MKTTLRLVAPLVAGSVLVALGCNKTPTTTQPTAPDPAGAQRSLMDVDELAVQPLSEDQAKAQLPERISVADAQRMLVHIDKSNTQEAPSYSLQARGGHGGGHGGHGGHFGGHGGHFGRGFGSFGWGGWGFGGLGLYGLGSLYGYGWPYYGYYGLGSYYYPYSLYGGYYYPYSYYPYWSGYRGLYRPYYW